jgi:DNA polymerase I-like protein with 3'-5' exonuclease and polymerase domains
MKDGQVVIPSGRVYKFKKEGKEFPRTKILNYPVQGLSADIMTLLRVAVWNKLKDEPRVKFIATVHDDIRLDVDNNPDLLYTICHTLNNAFKSIPEYFTRYFKTEYNVPMSGEVSFGQSLGNLVTFNQESFNVDYSNQCIPR